MDARKDSLAASSWLALDAPGCLDAARRSQHAAHRRDLGLVLAEEVVPGLVELEVAVPRLSPAVR